eukprot:3499490-Rhodomonas_salina.1
MPEVVVGRRVRCSDLDPAIAIHIESFSVCPTSLDPVLHHPLLYVARGATAAWFSAPPSGTGVPNMRMWPYSLASRASPCPTAAAPPPSPLRHRG